MCCERASEREFVCVVVVCCVLKIEIGDEGDYLVNLYIYMCVCGWYKRWR